MNMRICHFDFLAKVAPEHMVFCEFCWHYKDLSADHALEAGPSGDETSPHSRASAVLRNAMESLRPRLILSSSINAWHTLIYIYTK